MKNIIMPLAIGCLTGWAAEASENVAQCLSKQASGGEYSHQNTCSYPIVCLYNTPSSTANSFNVPAGGIVDQQPNKNRKCKKGHFSEVSNIPLSEW